MHHSPLYCPFTAPILDRNCPYNGHESHQDINRTLTVHKRDYIGPICGGYGIHSIYASIFVLLFVTESRLLLRDFGIVIRKP